MGWKAYNLFEIQLKKNLDWEREKNLILKCSINFQKNNKERECIYIPKNKKCQHTDFLKRHSI